MRRLLLVIPLLLVSMVFSCATTSENTLYWGPTSGTLKIKLDGYKQNFQLKAISDTVKFSLHSDHRGSWGLEKPPAVSVTIGGGAASSDTQYTTPPGATWMLEGTGKYNVICIEMPNGAASWVMSWGD